MVKGHDEISDSKDGTEPVNIYRHDPVESCQGKSNGKSENVNLGKELTPVKIRHSANSVFFEGQSFQVLRQEDPDGKKQDIPENEEREVEIRALMRDDRVMVCCAMMGPVINIRQTENQGSGS